MLIVFQIWLMLPYMTSLAPATELLWSDARNNAAAATSSGRTRRRSGI